MDVFDIEDLGGKKGGKGVKVARPRQCTMCRECIRSEGWADRVRLDRVKDHFIFSVESTGTLPAKTLVSESIKVLMGKAQNILQCLDSLAASKAGEAQ